MVSDLAQVNNNTVAECDNAYDRAKLQLERFNARNKRAQAAPEKEQPKKPDLKPQEPVSAPKPKQFNLVLDADKTRLSHILEIKKVLQEHPGDVPVTLEFQSGGKSLSTIQLKEGVSDREKFNSIS